jgi:hypothetical protein
MMGAMAARSNRSATARMLRELRRQERVTDSNIGLAALAETTARELDAVVAGDEKPYARAALARAHLAALQALTETPAPMSEDELTKLLVELTKPNFGTDDDRPVGFDDVYGPPRY